jgi:hypothetical protein
LLLPHPAGQDNPAFRRSEKPLVISGFALGSRKLLVCLGLALGARKHSVSPI